MKTILKVNNREHLLEALQSNEIDAIYLGNEGCFYKLGNLDELKEYFQRIKDGNKSIYYATPIIQQSHLEEMKYHINTILDWGIDYINIINDLGLLYYLGNYKKNPISIYLGRLLNRSIQSCPWSDHITRNENIYIKNVMLSNTANMQILVDYLEDFSVKGIEGNLTIGQTESFNQLKNKGFKLAVNFDYIYVTSGRICTTSYYLKRKPPECTSYCDDPLEIEFSRIRDVFNLKETYFESHEAQKLFGKMSVTGNIVMRENTLSIKDIEQQLFDAVIFDSRKYTNNQWNVLWEKIKGIKNCED